MSIRLTIAGLMGGVLVAALGMAALRSGSDAWSSVTFLITCAVLAFGIVGAVCGGASARAWWVGFDVFGWGYLAWAFLAPYGTSWRFSPPSLEMLRSGQSCLFATGPKIPNSYQEIAHCLCGLFIATLGGLLASLLYPPRVAAAAGPDRDGPPVGLSSRLPRRLPAAVGLAGLGLLASVAMAGSRTAPGLWAGASVLLTWGLLGLAAIGAVANRGVRRVRWFGAALFGMGFLILVSGEHDEPGWPRHVTNRLLDAARPWLPSVPGESPPSTNAAAAANRRIFEALDRPVPMRFPAETPLEDVLKHVAAATRGPDGRDLPLYVDPIGLLDAEKTITSPVTLNLDGVPLRTTLRLLLAQLGMVYKVDGGVLVITAITNDEEYREPVHDDPFLRTGRCVLALLAAVLGFASAPLVHGVRGEATERAAVA